MHKPINLSLLAGILFSGVMDGAQPLTVIVHNYAGVGVRALERAESEAARILGTAGVELKWVNCRSNIETSPVCWKPPDSMELVLDLLPAGATRRDASEGALGYAVRPDSGSFGSYAGVLYDRVERLRVLRVRTSVVLGHAIAHELGHLLLKTNWHAPSGIMAPEWHRKELDDAARGTLVFRAEDRRMIQENIRRRGVRASDHREGRTR
jgi:hypothetical protein